MKLFAYPAIFSQEEQGYSVSFPDLDGCFTEGDTLEEAFAMAKEAMGLWLDGEEQSPTPTPVDTITLANRQIVMLVEVDAIYMAQFKNKSVKKTLSIPEWLNIAAENKGINFSQTLQDALKEKLAVGE